MDDIIANKILLKPRFSILVVGELAEIKSIFKQHFATEPHAFRTKIIDNHLVIDVTKQEEHFWSPQLQLELETKNGETMIKGLYGPKPQLWTFFMMIHFAMAILFAVFAVLCYSQYTLDKNYTFSLASCIGILVLWVLFYILGQFGKQKGHDQMMAMNDYVKTILKRVD